MSIHITKKSIRATGEDASAILIAMASDDYLLKWEKTNHGSPQFQKMVTEAIDSRHLKREAN